MQSIDTTTQQLIDTTTQQLIDKTMIQPTDTTFTTSIDTTFIPFIDTTFTPSIDTTTIQSIVRAPISIMDQNCNNYDCKVESTMAEVCLVPVKNDNDINCIIPCQLSNCTFEIETSILCPQYYCMPLIQPTSTSSPTPPGPEPPGPVPPGPEPPGPEPPGPNQEQIILGIEIAGIIVTILAMHNVT